MKVYAVVRDDQDGHEYTEHLFSSRELAERFLGAEHEKLRRQYDRLVERAGSPIPRVGYRVKNDDGSKSIIPQREEHPGSFEDWLRSQDKGWIEERDVLTELPPKG